MKRKLEEAEGEPNKKSCTASLVETSEVELFRSFLRIPSISALGPKDGTYQKCVDFLQPLCAQLGKTRIKSYEENHPFLITTIPGKKPHLKSILLNGHYDVVPAEMAHWNWDPFAAEMTENGNIYARGTQDMKCVVMQYVLALIRLKKQNKLNFERTIHISLVPDEENAYKAGMASFVKDKELMEELNIGIALDEGLANPINEYTIFYGERAANWLRIVAKGPAGHGSRFVENTATIKLIECVNEILKFRDQQEDLLKNHVHHDCKRKTLGDVTTVNLTMLKSGVTFDNGETFALNVIPTVAEAGFDIRVAPDVPLEKFTEMVNEWTADSQLSVKWVVKAPKHGISSIEESDPWWSSLHSGLKQTNIPIQPEVFPAGTDSRFLRWAGYRAYGFSPMRNTPKLLHDHNEFLNKDVFLEGIGVYEKLIPHLANNPENDEDLGNMIAEN